MVAKKVVKKNEKTPVVSQKSQNIGERNIAQNGQYYLLAFLGAAVYYITTATSVWDGILGVLKALVWPAVLIFEILRFIGA